MEQPYGLGIVGLAWTCQLEQLRDLEPGWPTACVNERRLHDEDLGHFKWKLDADAVRFRLLVLRGCLEPGRPQSGRHQPRLYPDSLRASKAYQRDRPLVGDTRPHPKGSMAAIKTD